MRLMCKFGLHSWVRGSVFRTRVCRHCGKAQYWLREWEDI